MKKSQVALEFVLLVIFGLAILITALVVINSLTTDKIDEKSFKELEDLGLSIQKDLILITELEDGFRIEMNIPVKVNGRTYTIFNNNTSENVGYFTLTYQTTELFYAIPALNGTLKPGKNIITKNEGVIKIE